MRRLIRNQICRRQTHQKQIFLTSLSLRAKKPSFCVLTDTLARSGRGTLAFTWPVFWSASTTPFLVSRKIRAVPCKQEPESPSFSRKIVRSAAFLQAEASAGNRDRSRRKKKKEKKSRRVPTRLPSAETKMMIAVMMSKHIRLLNR